VRHPSVRRQLDPNTSCSLPTHRPSARQVVSLLALVLAPATALAQGSCSAATTVLETPNALDGAVLDSLWWDRDGAGPLPAELVIAGEFRRIGGRVVNGIARRDAVLGWQPLGAGCDGNVAALTVDGANRLVAGGNFRNAGGVAAPRIARFDGVQWSALSASPPALTDNVTALAAVGPTTLYFVTTLSSGNGPTLLRVFDGGAVANIPVTTNSSGVSGRVHDLALLPNGNILIGGSYTAIGGQAANNIAEYAPGVGVVGSFAGGVNAQVRDLDLVPGGFMAIGAFTGAGGQPARYVARWNGTAWSSYPAAGLYGQANGGGVNAAGDPVIYDGLNIREFRDGAWHPLFDLAVATTHVQGQPDGSLLIGNHTGFAQTRYGFFLSGGQVSQLADGATGVFTAAAECADGSLLCYVYGAYGTMSLTGLPAPGGFVRCGPSGWSVVPTGLRPETNVETMAQIVDILPQADGSFLVAGDFVSIGGAPIANIARFDGTAWQPVGSGIAEKVGAAVQLAGGDIVVLTLASRLARFDGAQWLTLAGPSTLNQRRALTPARDGGFFVGRSTYLEGVTTSHLERWSAQSTLTATVTLPGSLQVQRITQLRDDSVAITTTAGVLRYDGTTVQPLGALPNAWAFAVAGLPDGSIAASIRQTPPSGPTTRTTMRWDGSTWTALHPSGDAAPVALRNGDVLLVGTTFLDATRAAALARWTGGCPSASAAIASGCTAGAATLTSDAPWVGQTLRLEARGLPFAAFAVAVGSTQPANLPLASAFTTAIPGCTLLVQPDVTSLQFAANGSAQLAFAIPSTPAVVGMAFRQQFVSFAFDATLAVGATNALDLVVGGY
jgi:hypothetical protein